MQNSNMDGTSVHVHACCIMRWVVVHGDSVRAKPSKKEPGWRRQGPVGCAAHCSADVGEGALRIPLLMHVPMGP